jgi:hypothetical protein
VTYYTIKAPTNEGIYTKLNLYLERDFEPY